MLNVPKNLKGKGQALQPAPAVTLFCFGRVTLYVSRIAALLVPIRAHSVWHLDPVGSHLLKRRDWW